MLYYINTFKLTICRAHVLINKTLNYCFTSLFWATCFPCCFMIMTGQKYRHSWNIKIYFHEQLLAVFEFEWENGIILMIRLRCSVVRSIITETDRNNATPYKDIHRNSSTERKYNGWETWTKLAGQRPHQTLNPKSLLM